MSLKEFFNSIYERNISIKNAEMKQDEFNAALNALKKYSPKKPEYIKEKINILDDVKSFYDGRYMIINSFKDEIYPL